jgi:hypothetical protein
MCLFCASAPHILSTYAAVRLAKKTHFRSVLANSGICSARRGAERVWLGGLWIKKRSAPRGRGGGGADGGIVAQCKPLTTSLEHANVTCVTPL